VAISNSMITSAETSSASHRPREQLLRLHVRQRDDDRANLGHSAVVFRREEQGQPKSRILGVTVGGAQNVYPVQGFFPVEDALTVGIVERVGEARPREHMMRRQRAVARRDSGVPPGTYSRQESRIILGSNRGTVATPGWKAGGGEGKGQRFEAEFVRGHRLASAPRSRAS